MMIMYNGNIYTMDVDRPHATAIAIDHGRVLMVGEQEEVFTAFDGLVTKIERVDLKGLTLIPGLVDAHIHLENYALGLLKVDCETETLEECLQRVEQRATITTPGQWILGHGWNQNQWIGGYGYATDLDRVAPNNPVYLTAKSLHAAWANSAALRMAKITANSTDPVAGRIDRDQAGIPTGILFESAMDLVARAVPEPTTDQVIGAIQEAIPVLWSYGLTGVHDFDRRRCFKALQVLQNAGKLIFRVTKSIPIEDMEHAIGLGMHSGFGNDFLRIGSVKIFADGALGPRTAAMIQPYQEEPDNYGMLFVDAEELYEYGRRAVSNGLSLAVHAIGDRANHEVLNAYLQLRKYEQERLVEGTQEGAFHTNIQISPLRHRIEHVQLIHPEDVNRLAALGIVASMQPIHVISDMVMADRYWGERAALSYAWRSQLDNGAILAFGSDAPVDSPHPFLGLHAAITRKRLDGSSEGEGWYPEQCLTVAQALAAYTTAPAYVTGLEDRLGKLKHGYLADMVLLDVDPFYCDPSIIHDLHPVATMVDGQFVYRAHDAIF